jgi:hypothetical protein
MAKEKACPIKASLDLKNDVIYQRKTKTPCANRLCVPAIVKDRAPDETSTIEPNVS